MGFFTTFAPVFGLIIIKKKRRIQDDGEYLYQVLAIFFGSGGFSPMWLINH